MGSSNSKNGDLSSLNGLVISKVETPAQKSAREAEEARKAAEALAQMKQGAPQQIAQGGRRKKVKATQGHKRAKAKRATKRRH